jgi:hypothetical protein
MVIVKKILITELVSILEKKLTWQINNQPTLQISFQTCTSDLTIACNVSYFCFITFLQIEGKTYVHRYIANLEPSIPEFRFVCCQCKHLTYDCWYLVFKLSDHLLLLPIDYHVGTKTLSYFHIQNLCTWIYAPPHINL